MSLAIKVENLSKAYQLGQFGTGTISHDLERWFAKVRGKEDPFLKIGETNDRTKPGDSNIVWSLKDINFEIEQGDAVGIIGRNGAGKSTLLKILSRITSPTTGEIKVKGRMSSLLEVGTGFHPELSGRENIYLNGAILGMTRKEIRKKFDEIVDFAEVERYIDTPVKRYSSGMYVRLAFAVAANLNSDILIVDEVLAVGDAEFQKKCLGKMNYVSKGEGRTVLFVSHNMGAIKALCNNAILLKSGMTDGIQNLHQAISNYSFVTEQLSNFPVAIDELTINGFEVLQNGLLLKEYESESLILIKIDFELSRAISQLRLGLRIKTQTGDIITSSLFGDWQPDLENFEKGRYQLTGSIPPNFLLGGAYHVELHCSIHGIKDFRAEDVTSQLIKVISPAGHNVNHRSEPLYGYVLMNASWNLKVIKDFEHAEN